MIVERCFDKELIEDFIRSPEMFETISEDNQLPEDFSADVENDCWLKVEDKDLIGFYYLHEFTNSALIGHANIHPDYRKQYSKRAGLAVYHWIVGNCPQSVQKIITYVPEIYPNVIDYVELFHMRREGVNRKSYKKYGQLIDLVCYGITREEIKGFLCQPH